MNKLLNSFPNNYKPYVHQIPVLEEIQDALNNNTKFIILQAPTGSGKSMFASTIANYAKSPPQTFIDLVDDQNLLARSPYGEYIHEDNVLSLPHFGSYTLTVSKQLQDQYQKLFTDCVVFKGKNNYVCDIDDQYTCEIAPCLLSPRQIKDCATQKRCPYINERNRMLKSKFSVLNYSAFMCLPDLCKRREFIICDEGSEVEDELVKRFSVEINYHLFLKLYDIKIKKLLTDNRHKTRLWLTDIVSNVENKINEIQQKISKNKSSYLKKQFGDLIKLKKLVSVHSDLQLVLQNWNESEYIIEKSNENVFLSPLYVNNIAKHIFDYAKHVILMSATIIDHKTFARTLGIKDYKYIEVPSIFESKKSPIYCPGKYMLNYANINTNLPKVVKQTVSLCNEHNNEKGIIHTHNFKITEALQNETKNNKRFLFREPGISNETILKEHFLNDKNSIIVSPSLGLGTDLIGDQGKFQIIVKLPYLPLGTKRIKILSKKDYNWYIMKMLINLIQMSGRCTRSMDDEAATYILDGQAVSMLKKNWNKLPNWFKSRLM